MTAEEALDEVVTHSLRATGELLLRLGATEDEVEVELEHQRAELASWREAELAKLRGWMLRGGEELH